MPPAVSVVAMHPRRVQGWDAESAIFGSFSFLSRPHAAVIALIGADTPRSFSRREGTIESSVPVGPGVFDVALSGNHASTGMLAEWNSERFSMLAHLCRYLSGGAFTFPVALSRDYLLIGRRAANTHMLFGMAVGFTTVFEAAMISLVVSDKCS